MKKDWDAIVIGAGVAGLMAALRIAEKGKKVLVLEARDRIGGRIFSFRDAEWPIAVELGAEFIHGHPRETWDIVHEARLPVYDRTGEHVWLKNGRIENGTKIWERMEKLLMRMDSRRNPDRAFLHFLTSQKRLKSEDVSFVSSFIEGFQAAELDRAGERGLAMAQATDNTESAFGMAEGYDQLPAAIWKKAMGEGAVLRTGQIVRKVSWKNNWVSVEGETSEGQKFPALVAQALVVTVPLGVLKSNPTDVGFVQFSPEVPSLRDSLTYLEMGSVARLNLKFREAFWESRKEFARLGFLHTGAENFPTWWSTLPFRTPILTAWAGGGQAIRLNLKNEKDAVGRALGTLAKAFKISLEKLASQLEASAYHDWQRDPFSRGAYSYLGVDGDRAVKRITKPIEQTLFFAGEAFAPAGRCGTVDGALASGIRAAQQYLKLN